jgi:uncharacterized protein (TIGR03086 family)
MHQARRAPVVGEVRADACGGGRAGRLLTQAIGYALGNVAVLTPDLLARPTPCRSWDLRALLWHCCESLAALEEGFASGIVRPTADDASDRIGAGDRARDSGRGARDDGLGGSIAIPAFAARADALLAAAAATRWPDVTVGGQCLATSVLAAAGALEMAVHGWDVGQASGSRQPIPPVLAARLLEVAPILVGDADRAPLFAAPLTVECNASASDKLTAFLGRAGVPAPP